MDMLKNPFGAKPPAPGEGPSKEQRENGFYDVLFVAEMPDGRVLHYGVKGKYAPGYGSTSRLLAERGSALIAFDKTGGVGSSGGSRGGARVERRDGHVEIRCDSRHCIPRTGTTARGD